tara:strand:+ start:69 stop:236 length:168 start_codon:yes stop_codon:yes gene_type:complete
LIGYKLLEKMGGPLALHGIKKLGGPLILKAKDKLPFAKEAKKKGMTAAQLFKKRY